jgi:hypothetical protein
VTFAQQQLFCRQGMPFVFVPVLVQRQRALRRGRSNARIRIHFTASSA